MSTKFSAEVYAQFLREGKKRDVRFFTLRECAKAEGHRHAVLLRHDVDICLETALRMAHLEAAEGVCSTYFVLLRSPHYNALSPRNRQILQEMTMMGHEIGIHWDGRELPASAEEARKMIRLEADLLGTVCGQSIVSAAQHFPTTGERLDLTRDFKVDTYAPEFMKKFIYVSDSSMRWRAKDLDSVAAEPGHYHFLLHPVWWMHPGATQQEKLAALAAAQETAAREELNQFSAFVSETLAKRDELDAKFKSSMKSQ